MRVLNLHGDRPGCLAPSTTTPTDCPVIAIIPGSALSTWDDVRDAHV